MIFTKRFFIILSAFPLLLGLFWQKAVLVFALYNIFVLCLLLIDYFLTPPKNFLQIERFCEQIMSLDTGNKVTLKVKNKSKQELTILLKDEPPDSFSVSSAVFKMKVSGEEETYYMTTPHKRGNYKFGQINVRYLTTLGLREVQFKVNVPTSVKVYPNIKQIRSFRLLAIRGRLAEIGIRHSKLYGMGTNFESLREYQPDDEFRKINWHATARKNKLVAKQYEVEKSQNIILILDSGRLLSAPVKDMTKIDYALNASLMLAYVGVMLDDQVGLLAFSDRIKAYLPPKKGKKQFTRMINSLYALEAELVEANYRQAFSYLNVKHHKRSLIIIFSNIIDEESSRELINYASLLYPRHLPLCVLLGDEQVTNAANCSPATYQEVYEKAVAIEMLASRTQALKALRQRGVLTLDVSPSELSMALINKYLEIKGKGRL